MYYKFSHCAYLFIYLFNHCCDLLFCLSIDTFACPSQSHLQYYDDDLKPSAINPPINSMFVAYISISVVLYLFTPFCAVLWCAGGAANMPAHRCISIMHTCTYLPRATSAAAELEIFASATTTPDSLFPTFSPAVWHIGLRSISAGSRLWTSARKNHVFCATSGSRRHTYLQFAI
jgi:hypothetical protein